MPPKSMQAMAKLAWSLECQEGHQSGTGALDSLAYNVCKICIFSSFLVTFWQRRASQVPFHLQKVLKLFPIYNIVTLPLLAKPHTGVRV